MESISFYGWIYLQVNTEEALCLHLFAKQKIYILFHKILDLLACHPDLGNIPVICKEDKLVHQICLSLMAK